MSSSAEAFADFPAVYDIASDVSDRVDAMIRVSDELYDALHDFDATLLRGVPGVHILDLSVDDIISLCSSLSSSADALADMVSDLRSSCRRLEEF